jgi:hypothetical protein
MKPFRLPFSPILIHVSLAVCFAVGVPLVTPGQASRVIPAIERRIETLNRQAREYDREDLARGKKKESEAESIRRARELRMQVAEDLSALQTAYNDLVLTLRSSSAGPAESSVTASATEIRKRAARLKANLALPEPDAETQREGATPLPPPETPRKALGTLCRYILAFVTNPIFEAGAAFDVKHATQAGRDLEAIIEVSGRLSEPTKPN